MKGKLWELGPMVLAAAVALYLAATSFLNRPPAPTGAAPRASSGPQDPTRPEDFLPDPHSKPDPNAPPDPSLSTAAAAAPRRP